MLLGLRLGMSTRSDDKRSPKSIPWIRPKTFRMAKPKRKLTAAEKLAKKERQKKYQWIFINGKRVRVKRPETIEGMAIDEYIAANADPIWLHQNGMWECIDPDEFNEATGPASGD